jgi:hypothetical protein
MQTISTCDFGGTAMNTVVYVLNRTRIRTLDRMIPFEAWFQTKPSMAHIKVFGSNAY